MIDATATSFSLPIKHRLLNWKAYIYIATKILLHYLSGLIVFSVLLLFLSNYEIDPFSWSFLFTSIFLLGIPFFINLLRKDAYGFFQAAKQRTLPRNAVDSMLSVVFVLSSLTSYAINVYPKLSPVYGGGKQQRLILVVKPDQVMQLKSLGINVSPENRQIGPLEVIYEAADYLILSTPEEIKERKIQSIRLRKDMFDAILHVDYKYVKTEPSFTTTPTPTPSPQSTVPSSLGRATMR